MPTIGPHITNGYKKIKKGLVTGAHPVRTEGCTMIASTESGLDIN